jgi:hypothetical protein
MLHEQGGGYTMLGRTAVVRGSVVLCVVILLGIMGAGCAADSTASVSTRFSVIHTSAIPKPEIMAYETVLGGAVYAFDRKFGSSNCCTSNGWDYQGPFGPMWTGVEYDGQRASNAAIYEQAKVRVKAIENMGIHITSAR